MQTIEINGFLIDELINISLKREKSKAYVLFVLTIENPRTKTLNVRLMIGNGVSVLVTTVIHHFNYTRINVKVLVKRFM